MQHVWSEHQLAQFKKILQQDVQRLKGQISSLQAQHQDTDSNGEYQLRDELSTVDNHPADHGTALYEQQRDISLVQHFEHQLDETYEALDRIEQDNYGYCIVCHQPIEHARLEAAPATMYCHKDMASIEAEQNIHNMYEYSPKSFIGLNDDDTEFTGFDGEDATQAILEYGNSNIGQVSANPLNDDDDELHGFVEPLETFIATDITGRHVHIVRNKAYQQYLQQGEGDHELENYSD